MQYIKCIFGKATEAVDGGDTPEAWNETHFSIKFSPKLSTLHDVIAESKLPFNQQYMLKDSFKNDNYTRYTLGLKIVRAINLRDVDVLTTSDPCCLASVQGPAYSKVPQARQQFQTQTKWNTLHPQWDESFTFDVSSYFTESLVVEVRDYDTISVGDLLGAVSIPIATLQVGKALRMWRSLGRANGHVLLEMSLARNDESDL